MARWLGFIDESGRPRPTKGEGSVEDVVSHLPKTQAALLSGAVPIARRADLLLDILPEVRTGASRISLERGDLDYYVMLTDETVAAAASIEKRHGVLRKAINK